MKFLFFFFVVAVAFFSVEAFTKEQIDKFLEDKKACVSETGVKEGEIKKLKDTDFSNGDESVKKFVYCLMTKQELATEEGQFVKANIIKASLRSIESKLEKNLDKCAEIVGTDKYDTLWKVNQCFAEKNPNVVNALYEKTV